MYHRVSDSTFDPWGLSVAPQRFHEQIELLGRLCKPLPLEEFVRQLEESTLPPNAVSITFDDGYLDNLEAALPALSDAGVPATVFVASGFTGAREFWWDEVARLVFFFSRGIDCEVSVGRTQLSISLAPDIEGKGELPEWKDWQTPRTERENLYLEICSRLRPLSRIERDYALSQIRGVLTGTIPECLSQRPMTSEEIRTLTDPAFVTIGAHTVSHPELIHLPPEEQRHEIATSKRDCELLSRVPVKGFSYPHGRFDHETRNLVRGSGFTYACTSVAQFVEPNSYDVFALPRFQVMNWSANALEHLLTHDWSW